MFEEGGCYSLGAAITGFLVFIGVWIYALASWGFLIGVAIGWLPAIIVAGIAGLLWPLILLVAIILFVIATKSSG